MWFLNQEPVVLGTPGTSSGLGSQEPVVLSIQEPVVLGNQEPVVFSTPGTSGARYPS